MLWQTVSALAVLPSDQAAGSEIDWTVRFNGLIDGTPRAGICLWVDDATIATVAKLYALVIDYDVSVMRLIRWNNASLINEDRGTLLGTISGLPAIGDLLLLQMNQFPANMGANTNNITASWRNANDVSITDLTVLFDDTPALADHQKVRHRRCGVGFVSIGGSTAGKLAFSHSPLEPTVANPACLVTSDGETH